MIRIARATTTTMLEAQNEMDAQTTVRVGPVTVMHPLTATQRVLLKHVGLALQDCELLRIVGDAIDGESIVSLRMLDWLVTNYAKRRALCVTTTAGKRVHVYEDYRAALATFRRRNFDPFCRSRRRTGQGETVDHCVVLREAERTHSTSLGQLNFMIWAVQRGVLQYARQHAQQLQRDMNLSATRARKEKGAARGRLTLSSPPPSKCRAFLGSRRIDIT